MLGLPPTTEVKRPLPKVQLFKRFDWTPSQRDRFDGEVSRLDFVNWISPRTVPAIAVGNEVKEIFVVEVSLKSRDFESKAITLLAKYIPQRIVYILRYEDEAMLAVYHTKLFTTDWHLISNASNLIPINGLNLDAVWEGIVRSIVGTSLRDVSNECSQSSQIQHAKGLYLSDKHAKGLNLSGKHAKGLYLSDKHAKGLNLSGKHAKGMSLQDFSRILTLFSPISKEKSALYPNINEEIDVLIATDCISEGQNLQDCDYLINYDIHWNPVRIIQRFGRIDRIGSLFGNEVHGLDDFELICFLIIR